MKAVDTNVLVYAEMTSSPHHEAASARPDRVIGFQVVDKDRGASTPSEVRCDAFDSLFDA